MEMTRERLEQYRSQNEEIVELKQKLERLSQDENMIGNSVILDYQTGYPRPQSIVGRDYAREERVRKAQRERLQKLEAECAEIELWVEAIPDSLTRRIFRMYFLDGIRQDKIARRVHLGQATISKKISAYLQME